MAAPLDLCRKHLHLRKIRLQWLNIIRNRSETSSKGRSDFSLLIRKRYLQAKRSVIIRTQRPDSTLKALQKHDRLSSAFFTSPEQGYILAEFEDNIGVQRLLRNGSFFPTPTQFPLHSRCLCDINSGGRNISQRKVNRLNINHYPKRSNGEYPLLGSLEAELVYLHKQRSLTELDLRLRFMMCLLIEDVVQMLSPDIHVVPFGSCLNGFGWWDSDLDMMLCLRKDPFHVVPSENSETSIRFLTEVFPTERHLAHHSLSMVSSLLELMPRTTRVHKILHARVPIIRFKHILMNLECDISLQAVDSIRMTELLHLLSGLDERLKLLMTVIKEWAISQNQTSSGEKQKPTTLGLLFLLIFFLQTRSPPVLPTLRQVQSYARLSNPFMIEGVRYHLPLSKKSIPPSTNTESVESLLIGFFKFFSTFDFESKGISITDGCVFDKVNDSSPLLVENPLCIGLNICKNVSSGQVENLQEAMAEAFQVLEKLHETKRPDTSWLSSFICDNPSDEKVNIKIDTILSDFSDSEENETSDYQKTLSDVDSGLLNHDLSNVNHKK